MGQVMGGVLHVHPCSACLTFCLFLNIHLVCVCGVPVLLHVHHTSA